MTSTYTHATALKIYTAIAAAGENGVDVDQLMKATDLAGNTIRSYARWLEQDGAIAIEAISSDAQNKPLKNLYLAIREPRVRLSERDKLKQVVELLTPYSRHPKTWDKATKANIIEAIQKAILAAAE